MEHKRKLKIRNDLGLHGRSAAKIVELVNKHKSKLYFKKNDSKEVDGTNILSILTLACPKGCEVEVRAVGEDAEGLLNELSMLFERKFDEKK